MKIVINTKGHRLALDGGGNIGAFFEALKTGFLCQKSYSDDAWSRVGTDERPETFEIEMVQDEYFAPLTPILNDMKKTIEQANKNWVECYNRALKAEKELAELKEKVKAMTADEKAQSNDAH